MTTILARLACGALALGLLGMLLAVGADCRPVDPLDNGNDNGITDSTVTHSLATTPENETAVNAALDAAEELLREGVTLEEARDELLARLQADPQVLGALLDPDSGAVYADFPNGETQIFSIIDETDSEGSVDGINEQKALIARALDDAALRAPPVAPRKGGTYAGTGLDTYWRMPANNRALLVNAIQAFHPKLPFTNSTLPLWKMLSDRGYEVEPPEDLTVEHFLHLTDYGLIIIEAHGLWRKPTWTTGVVFPSDTCGGSGAMQALLTTTVVTPESLIANAADVVCGRLMTWNTSLRDPNRRTKRLQTYAVTPHFIREHDQGVFPSNTILLLNACRGFDQEAFSAYEELLFDKCGGGAMFLGWTQKVDYAYAGRALLNLFQLATCSNEPLVAGGANVLRQHTPPQGNFASMRMAWGQLNSRGWTFDPDTLGQLIYTDQQQDFRDVVIMPHLLTFLPGVDAGGRNEYRANLWSVGIDPRLSINAHDVTLQRESNGLFALYRLSGVTDPYFGNLQLSETNRFDAPRTLYRWRPSITITNVGGPLQYQITMTLQARAALTNGRTSFWLDPPRATFGETYWDKPQCVVAWNFSGEQTYDSDYGRMRAVYSGSGARAFLDSDHGGLRCSGDGTTVDLDASAYITYTTTTHLDAGEVSTYDTTASAVAAIQGATLSDLWTIGAVTYQANSATLGDYQVKWNAIPAEPPFDPAVEPR